MSTRKIKDAKDLSTNELIYFKGHAQATYMSDGRTVEEAITSSTGGSGGTIDTSNLATKTELAQKQDIISDIDTIRTNAANYKGTVTGVIIDDVRYIPTNGVIDLGYINKKVLYVASSTLALESGKIYVYNQDVPLSLTFTLVSPFNTNILHEYLVQFKVPPRGCTVAFPSEVQWVNGIVPTFEPEYTYQISITKDNFHLLGSYIKFA